MPTDDKWLFRDYEPEEEEKRYREEIKRTRMMFSRGSSYRGYVIAEALGTLFFLGIVDAAGEVPELPRTRIEWVRLILKALLLVWMFHLAHTSAEAMFRRQRL
jgi:hypothetical protein